MDFQSASTSTSTPTDSSNTQPAVAPTMTTTNSNIHSVISSLPCLPSIPNSSSNTISFIPLTNTIIPETEQQLISITTFAQASVKLSPSNYQVWYSQWHSILIGYNFASYVVTPPTEAQTNSLYWVRQDQLLQSALVASLTIEVASYVLSEATSYDVWTTLYNLYARPSRTHIMTLKESCTGQQRYQIHVSM